MAIKTCKPNYRMQHFDNDGCQSTYIFKYGACKTCFREWATTTTEGRAWHKKATAWKMKENAKAERVEKRAEKREMKIQLMNTSTYWSKIFQPKINEIVRIIDNGCGCIVTNSTLGKQAAGHFTSVGSNKTLSLNLSNIYLQSFQSNGWRGGEPIQYMEGLIRVFGQNYTNYVLQLKRCPPLNISKIELLELYPILLKIKKELKAMELYCLSAEKRIEHRSMVNTKLGLYPKEFCVYDPNKKY